MENPIYCFSIILRLIGQEVKEIYVALIQYLNGKTEFDKINLILQIMIQFFMVILDELKMMILIILFFKDKIHLYLLKIIKILFMMLFIEIIRKNYN